MHTAHVRQRTPEHRQRLQLQQERHLIPAQDQRNRQLRQLDRVDPPTARPRPARDLRHALECGHHVPIQHQHEVPQHDHDHSGGRVQRRRGRQRRLREDRAGHDQEVSGHSARTAAACRVVQGGQRAGRRRRHQYLHCVFVARDREVYQVGHQNTRDIGHAAGCDQRHRAHVRGFGPDVQLLPGQQGAQQLAQTVIPESQTFGLLV